MIKFDGHELPTQRPAELDEKLVNLTGCNAAETVAAIGNFSTAQSLAFAILPFLKTKLSMQALAQLIEPAMIADRQALIDQIKALYVEPEAHLTPSKEAQ